MLALLQIQVNGGTYKMFFKTKETFGKDMDFIEE